MVVLWELDIIQVVPAVKRTIRKRQHRYKGINAVSQWKRVAQFFEFEEYFSTHFCVNDRPTLEKCLHFGRCMETYWRTKIHVVLAEVYIRINKVAWSRTQDSRVLLHLIMPHVIGTLVRCRLLASRIHQRFNQWFRSSWTIELLMCFGHHRSHNSAQRLKLNYL